MTKLMQKALEKIRGLSDERQDEIARVMLSLARRDAKPEQIEPADLPPVLKGLAEARCGDLATDTEVESAFRRFDG